MKNIGYLVPVILIIFILIGGITGYVKNIVKLTNCDFESPYKAEVVHGLGLIPVVGAITGWIDVGE